MYFEQSKATAAPFLMDAIEIANSCDLKYKTSRNQRLLVELCLMQLASLTAVTEKKNPSLTGKRFVLPPSHFKQVVARPQEKIDAVVPSEEIPSEEIPSEVSPSEEKVATEIVAEVQDIESAPALDKAPSEDVPKPEIPVTTTEEKAPTPDGERVIERPQILAERNAKKVSALSIKSIQKKQQFKKELVAKQPDQANLPKEDFSEEEMVTVWNDYAKEIEDKGQYNLLSHLTMGVPKLEGALIHLEFPNDTIRVEVERAKYDLLTYLREKLSNYDIDLSIEVNETAEKRYAYTAREKFEKLKEKNPLIENLRKEFDLDV